MKLVVVLCLYQSLSLAVDNITFSLISTFAENTNAMSGVFFSCWSLRGKKYLYISMSIMNQFLGIEKGRIWRVGKQNEQLYNLYSSSNIFMSEKKGM
jgi:hypothetical protein